MTHAACIGATAVLFGYRDLGQAFAEGADLNAVDPIAEVALESANFGPPVLNPRNILCVGLNYASHIREMGRDLPQHPTLFQKTAGALLGPHDDLILPKESSQVDWEAELAFIIGGRPVRRADEETARSAIAGYTVLNDITMRDWQYRTLQWHQGKNWDDSTPVGPVLVTGDEIQDAADLRVTCTVNGQTMQDAQTSDLVFDPVSLVQYISTFVTLMPGDVISTGTAGGVGHAREPALYLQADDEIVTEIEGIGALRNQCVAGSAPNVGN